jgi:signal transduction histidine kinase
LNIQSTRNVLKARLAGRRLFVKVFLWFWLAAVLLFAIFIGGRVGTYLLAPTEVVAAFPAVVANEAVRAYESGGPREFARFEHTLMGGYELELYLIDRFGREVLSRPIPSECLAIVRNARADGRILVRSGLNSRSGSYRFVSPSGQPYVLLFYERLPFSQAASALGLPFFGIILLIVTLFCFWLAHHIAAPIQEIQSAARKVASGDLSVRAPAKISKRHDELAELAVDFDSMVERIGVLIAAQRDLLNTVSHELRSPLARFNVSMALLRKQSSSQSEPLLQRMEREVGRVDVLMGQILTLLRLEAGLSSREWQTVNFSQLVEEVVADGDFEAQAFGKSVRLQAETDISIEKADEHALRSACENVVRNAIRFTPPGSQVEVILKSEESSLPQAVLSIRDHGPGVPEDFLPQIFKPFFRLQSPSGARTENNGTGLGLAIALEAVRQHRGSIVALNTIPTGLEVRIMLPMRLT